MNDSQHKRWIATCTFCPTLCLYTCPVSNAEGRDSVTPWAKMSLIGWLEQGVEPLDHESAAFAYKCLGCLACNTPCRHDVQVPDVLFAARARAVRAGLSPFEAALFCPEEAARSEGEPLLTKLRAAAPSERFVDEAQVLLVPGAETLLWAPEIVSDLFALADLLALDYLAVGEASAMDTGYELWAAGFLDLFLARARTFVSRVARYRKLVLLSPHDLYMLRVVYPRLELGPLPAIESGVSLLAEKLGRQVARAPYRGQVRYHDPCFLGRHLESYQGPRRALSFACHEPPLELRWHHSESYCCGGGGGLKHTSPATADHAAATVTDNARSLGTDLLVGACATCVKMFREAAPDLKVEHLISVLGRAFTVPDRDEG